MNEEELEGVELARAVARIEACGHEYVVEIKERWTSDARKEIVKTEICKKCGNWKREIIKKESVNESAFWR